MDCGSNGDCLFLCLEEGFKNIYNPLNEDFSVENLRELTANQINRNNFTIILENYRVEYDNGEFEGLWNPYEIKNIEDLQNNIKKQAILFGETIF